MNNDTIPKNFYTSDQILGKPVVNAFTGKKYDDITFGSNNEHLLWTVKLFDDSDKYFFDTPDEYEYATLLVRKNIIKVSDEDKEKWSNKRQKYLSLRS